MGQIKLRAACAPSPAARVSPPRCHPQPMRPCGSAEHPPHVCAWSPCVCVCALQRGVGDFRFYQGVWRLQPLPGCAPPGASAMRLTYSVELSPRAWVPVALLEGRIAAALGENLEAVRDYVVARDGEPEL